MDKRITLVLVIGFIVLIVVLAFFLMGILPAIVFTVAFGGGFILWVFTTYKTPVNPHNVIIPYLFAILLFIVHVYEEYITDFEGLVTDITGFHVLEKNFLTIAAFLAPIIWIGGAILLLKKIQFGYYALSAFFVAMTIAELSHFIFPFMEDGTFHYASGMYTAALPLIPAFYGLRVVLKEIKDIKNES